jgi:hypothetical protein
MSRSSLVMFPLGLPINRLWKPRDIIWSRKEIHFIRVVLEDNTHASKETGMVM